MRVVVVGAGLSGVFTGSELTARGAEVTLMDEAEKPGGVTTTIRRDGFLLEPGAGALMLPDPHLSPLVARSGTTVSPARAADRYLFDGERLHRLQPSPRLLATPVLPAGAKLRALAEPLVRGGPANDESLQTFLTRRFGARAGELMAWAAACGVYAGDPSRLSATAAFPALTSLAGSDGSLVRGLLGRRRSRPRDHSPPRPHLPEGGMSSLIRGLAGSAGLLRPGFHVSRVIADGDRWLVEGSDRLTADRVVLAVGPERAAQMVDHDLAGHLRRAVAAPVAVVGLGGRDEVAIPPGFGALTTPGAGTVGLGFLFESSYAPGRAPDGGWLIKVVAGGATRPEVAGWDEEKLVATTVAEASRVVGGSLQPGFVEVIRHRPGIPQYQVGHRAWLAQLDRMLAERPGLHLTGWGYRGVGVSHVAGDAVRVAEAVMGG